MDSQAVLSNKRFSHGGLQTTAVGSYINAGTAGDTGSRVEAHIVGPITHDNLLDVSKVVQHLNKSEGWVTLRRGTSKQAVDNGSAVVLDDSSLGMIEIYLIKGQLSFRSLLSLVLLVGS